MEEYGPRPFGYGDLEEKIKKIKGAEGPVKAFVIGKSVLGRSIYALGMGQLRQSALMVGATHGLESITSALLMMFAEELMEALENRTQICGVDPRRVQESRGLIIVPMLNPDGVEIAQHGARGCLHLAKRIYDLCDGHFERWQANARGVDLNHNFDAGFQDGKALEPQNGIYGPGPTRFGGKAPFSEPETAALRDYVQKQDFCNVYAFHSQGEEIYCDYNGRIPEHGLEMARILAKVSGYAVEKVEGLTSCRGFKDWFIEKYDRPGFTIEIGRGANPLPLEQFPEIYRKLRELLILAATL